MMKPLRDLNREHFSQIHQKRDLLQVQLEEIQNKLQDEPLDEAFQVEEQKVR